MRVLSFWQSFKSNVKKHSKNCWSSVKNTFKRYKPFTGRTEEAIERIHKIYNDGLNNCYDIAHNEGKRYLDAKKYTLAIKSFSSAIQFNEQNLKSYFLRAHCFQKTGDYQEAINDYNTIIKIHPNNAKFYQLLGDCYYKLGDIDKAIDSYSKAIELDPKDKESYLNRGLRFRSKEEHELAIKDLNQRIKIDPTNIDVYFLRATCHGSLKNHDQAIQDYNKFIEHNPEDLIALYQRGLALQEKGSYDLAIEDFNKIIQISSYKLDGYLHKGICLRLQKKHDKAILVFNELLKNYPKESKGYSLRSNCWMIKGDFNKAIKDQNKALELNPKDYSLYHERAFCYYKLHKIDECIEDYKKFLELTPHTEGNSSKIFYSQNRLIETFLENSRYDELDEFIGKLKNLKDDMSQAHYYYAKARIAKDWHFDNQEALELANKAINHNPHLINAYKLRSSIHQAYMNREQELKDLQKILQINPLDPTANYRLGELTRNSDPAQATKFFITAIEQRFEESSSRYLRDYVDGQSWKAESDPVLEFINNKKEEFGFVEKEFTGYGTNCDEPESSTNSLQEEQGWTEAMLLTDIKELERQSSTEELKKKYQKLMDIYIQNENYEKAAELRDKIAQLGEQDTK